MTTLARRRPLSGSDSAHLLPASGANQAGWVDTLDRVSDKLRSFLLSVESGEYFRAHRKSFDPHQRVDRELLRNLKAAREHLDKVKDPHIAPESLDALLCRLVFTCYLFDRGVIDGAYLEEIDVREAKHLRDILGRKPRAIVYRHETGLGEFGGKGLILSASWTRTSGN